MFTKSSKKTIGYSSTATSSCSDIGDIERGRTVRTVAQIAVRKSLEITYADQLAKDILNYSIEKWMLSFQGVTG